MPKVSDKPRQLREPAGANEALGYSIDSVARITALSRSKIYLLIGEGRLKRIKIGTRAIIPAESVRRLLSGEAI